MELLDRLVKVRRHVGDDPDRGGLWQAGRGRQVPREVGRGRQQRTATGHDWIVPMRGRRAREVMSGGETFLTLAVKHGVVQSKGSQDSLAEQVLKAGFRGGRQREGEDGESEVRVGQGPPGRARRGPPKCSCHVFERDRGVRIGWVRRTARGKRVGQLRQPGGVGRELHEPQIAETVGHLEVRGDRVVEAHLASGHHLRKEERGEGLRHRPDVEADVVGPGWPDAD